MPTNKRWRKIFVALAAAGILTIATSSEPHDALAQASSAQGKFNMSYMYFGSPSSYTTQVDKSGQTLDVVAPSYFHIDANGNLELSDSLLASFIADMHQRGKRVVPFLSNDFDRSLGEKAIDNREALADQIVKAIQDNNLDGIQFDIENVDAAYRDKYTDLVKIIRNKLGSDKEVSVAVAANPTGTTQGWTGLYDYKALAAVTDYLMVMAYDESYPGDTTPGPVASLPFVEKSIQYAISQAPADKVVLGIPFYGRYWNQNAADNGAGVSAQTLSKLIQKYGGTVRYDTASQSPVASFTILPTDESFSINGNSLVPGDYTVWFENEQSLKEKLKLVSKYNLKGTGSWSLNQETADTWDYYGLWADGFYFTDVQQHWAKEDILAAANNGWMLGTAADRFAPDAALTRAEAATIIVRALGLQGEAAGSASFTDVPASHWASQDIRIAKSSGLIQGISDERFAPDQIITREEMSMLLSRALHLTSQGGSAAAKSFSDVPAGSWSAEAIAAMSSNGLVDGYANGTFRPGASLTRAEMAALLNRAQPLLTK
ncbi:S-layer homology domain-containing protein [Paenibacillus sp. CGMCC 1.16610]|uniref:Glycoside hydrolase n=1 Tax=Paenibacillus anseongense TaxID=2682845 RepID=A0ABW9UG28_9BACL|nr:MULTISPECIES: S-layer homology domain-containing protein [Paenibacillus]MBA2942754.1 S-layer homology domain-containing protein [Paenibacillus sp. CGMCC 1.16610]MVQ38240.1 glycoside hydrolase [Paenibacillus anseongense]